MGSSEKSRKRKSCQGMSQMKGLKDLMLPVGQQKTKSRYDGSGS